MAEKKKKVPYTAGDVEIDRKIDELLNEWGVPGDFNWFREMMVTVLKFAKDKPNQADVRQFNIALKEMRYAEKVFHEYEGIKTVAVFGSARTKPEDSVFQAAKNFARMMRDKGYMIITGGGEGIMAAAQQGAGRDRSFALNIILPFEQTANQTIDGDRKLITFRYFFTRKLNFVKHSSAIALFPGGFGTMDEGFEAMTLMQTGKAPIIPIVFIEEDGGTHWRAFEQYLREHLLRRKLISPNDFHLFKVTQNLEEARDEIVGFYNNFHSYRYVGDICVIRVFRGIPDEEMKKMNEEFKDILVGKEGFDMRNALPQEINEPEIAHLPRLCFHFNRHGFGRLRQVIDRVNQF